MGLDSKPMDREATTFGRPLKPQSGRLKAWRDGADDVAPFCHLHRKALRSAANPARSKPGTCDRPFGAESSGITAGFGGTDAETALEGLVCTLPDSPASAQAVRVPAGRDNSFVTPGETLSSVDSAMRFAAGNAAPYRRMTGSDSLRNAAPPH